MILVRRDLRLKSALKGCATPLEQNFQGREEEHLFVISETNLFQTWATQHLA